MGGNLSARKPSYYILNGAACELSLRSMFCRRDITGVSDRRILDSKLISFENILVNRRSSYCQRVITVVNVRNWRVAESAGGESRRETISWPVYIGSIFVASVSFHSFVSGQLPPRGSRGGPGEGWGGLTSPPDEGAPQYVSANPSQSSANPRKAEPHRANRSLLKHRRCLSKHVTPSFVTSHY